MAPGAATSGARMPEMNVSAAFTTLVPDEADDVLDGIHGFGRDRLRALGAVGEHPSI